MLVVELVVILTDSFCKLIDIPLVQRVDELQTLFLLVFLHEIVGAKLDILRVILHEGLIPELLHLCHLPILVLQVL